MSAPRETPGTASSASELNAQGIHLAQGGDVQGAFRCFREAVRADPAHASAWSNLGNAARLLNDLDEAQDSLERSLALLPDFQDARYNLALVYEQKNLLTRAHETLTQLTDEHPGNIGALLHLAIVKQRLYRWDEVAALHSPLWTLGVSAQAINESPFYLLALYDDPGLHACYGRLRGNGLFARRVPALGPLHTQARQVNGKTRRMRIGYFSSDFWSHATMFLLGDVMAMHDRDRIELFVYSYGRVHDQHTARLAAGVEHFVDLRGASHATMAKRMRADRLDLLIDLKGYTKESAVQVLGYRVAPLQWHFLGYPGSLGSPEYVDAILADAAVIPDPLRALYSERVHHVAPCYQPSPRQRSVGPPSGLRSTFPQGAILLGNFNQSYKHSKTATDCWLRVLQRCPKAHLCLLDDDAPEARVRLAELAANAGVAGDRIRYLPKSGQPEHLSRIAEMDLILDDFPYNGHTTSSDALWSGVPVVTRRGRSFASRVSASLLNALGLPALVADDPAHFVEIAVYLVEDGHARQNLSRHLLDQRRKHWLYDTKRFATHIEDCAERAWLAGA